MTVAAQQQQQQQPQSPPEDNGFVVHKGRGVPTLASLQQDPLIAARLRMAKEKTNADSKAEERGENWRALGGPLSVAPHFACRTRETHPLLVPTAYLSFLSPCMQCTSEMRRLLLHDDACGLCTRIGRRRFHDGSWSAQ